MSWFQDEGLFKMEQISSFYPEKVMEFLPGVIEYLQGGG